MSGIVVVAGVFQPGSVVTLWAVPDERVLRPEGHDEIGKRIVDDAGNVGWDELAIGGRFLVTGYVNGLYVIVRARAVDGQAPDTELLQAPVQPTPQTVGTQESKLPPEPPAPPENAEQLPVGLPDGVKSNVLGEAAPGAAQAPPSEPEPAPLPPASPAAEPAPAEAGEPTAAGQGPVPEGGGAAAPEAPAAEQAAGQPAEAAPSTDQPAQPAAAEAAEQPAAPAADQPPA